MLTESSDEDYQDHTGCIRDDDGDFGKDEDIGSWTSTFATSASKTTSMALTSEPASTVWHQRTTYEVTWTSTRRSTHQDRRLDDTAENKAAPDLEGMSMNDMHQPITAPGFPRLRDLPHNWKLRLSRKQRMENYCHLKTITAIIHFLVVAVSTKARTGRFARG